MVRLNLCHLSGYDEPGVFAGYAFNSIGFYEFGGEVNMPDRSDILPRLKPWGS